MKLNLDADQLLQRGVYKIVNKTTGKYYIGSTIMSFLKRFLHHRSRLRCGKHKNSYLQNAYNKYGDSDFEFFIIETCDKDQCFVREQYWLDLLDCTDKTKSYNINPIASSVTCKESIEKRRQTMLRKYANGELEYMRALLKGKEPWNKGKKYVSTNHLKVPKTRTEKLINARNFIKLRRRELADDVYVYDLHMVYLGCWNSAKDLEEWSLTSKNNLPISGRFNSPRMGKPLTFLQSCNINKSCKTGRPYKGLIFSNTPLHQVTDVEKQGKNGEV